MIEMSGNLFSKLLVLLGLAAISGMVYSYMSTNKINNTIADISQLVTNIQAMYANTGNYATLTNAVVLNSKDAAPAEMIVGGALVNQWGNAITVQNGAAYGGGVTNNQIAISMILPQAACIKVLSNIKASIVQVGGFTGRVTPVDPAQIASDCANQPNTLVWLII